MAQKLNYSFTKTNRLLLTRDFDKVLKSPSFKVSQGPVLLLLKKNGLNISRLGLIIPKRRLRKAVDRNTLKRKSRETFRLNQSFLSGFDLVLLLRAPINDWDQEVKVYGSNLRSALEKAVHIRNSKF